MTTTTISVGPEGSGPSITTTTAVVYEHDDLNHTLAAALTQDDASRLCEAWSAQNDDVQRAWTFPDDQGDYDGIVLASVYANGVTLDVWDAREQPGGLEDPMLIYSTWDFPFIVTITQEG
jgi:hypothetical protein